MSVVKELREKGSSEDRDTVKKLRKTQTNLRLMQSELVVEEAVRDRSMKVQRFYYFLQGIFECKASPCSH